MAMVGSITRGEVMGTPGTQIEWVTDNDKSTDHVRDYTDLIKENAFIGDVPFDSIIDGLTTQFNDYIDMEDTTNYVDVFYDQLHASYDATKDEDEEHSSEIIEILDGKLQVFIDKICDLFEQRLTLTFADVAGESVDHDDLEFLLRRMYEFFILGAKNNFKTVIAFDVLAKAGAIEDNNKYFSKVQELMFLYSPIITTIGPMEFLRYRNDTEVIEMFENGKVVGNFLRKYSPKFYQNEEFLVEVINHVTMVQHFKTDLINSTEGFDASTVSQPVKEAANTAIKNYLEMVREPVCEEDDGSGEPAVYDYGPNYENEYEVGPYKD